MPNFHIMAIDQRHRLLDGVLIVGALDYFWYRGNAIVPFDEKDSIFAHKLLLCRIGGSAVASLSPDA
jgi:hypothetical protein